MRSITQRSLPNPEPWLVLRLAIRGVIPRSRSAVAVLAAVIRPVGEQRLWPELPVRPVGGTRSTSANSSVMSLRLPAVRVTARGMPWPSQITWCLEPGRRRSTGEGPVFSPPLLPAHASCQRPHETSPAAGVLQLVQEHLVQALPNPASFQSRRHRQHVIPDPQPISCGRSSHGIPVLRTNRMPARACRSGTRLRPGYRYRRSTRGNNGPIRAHNPSLTKGFAINTPTTTASQNPFLLGALSRSQRPCSSDVAALNVPVVTHTPCRWATCETTS